MSLDIYQPSDASKIFIKKINFLNRMSGKLESILLDLYIPLKVR